MKPFNLSIKKLTLLIFIVMYFLFFFITSINIYSYSQYEYKNTETLICNYNSSLSNQINQKLNNVVDVSKYPLIIPEIGKLHEILSKNESFNIEDYNYLLYLCEMMLIQNDTVNGAYIYDLNGSGVFTTRNSTNDTLKNPLYEEWFKNFIESSNQSKIISNINSTNIFEFTNSENEQLIGVCRKIINIKTQKVTGIILLTINPNELLSTLNEDLPFSSEIISLFNSDGSLLKTTDDDLSNDNNNALFSFIDNYSDEPNIKYTSSQDIVCYNSISYANLNLINYIPMSSTYHLDSFYLLSIVTILAFSLIFFIIIYVFFLRRIFNPINSLIENMSTNVESNLTYKFIYNKNDEIGILINSYNKMKSRINNLININYKTKLEQKELELRQLQNQINPHFIYNTLESIHMMAEINDDLETSTMAEYFGSIIRYSMNRKINTVTLKEEMNIIDNYIYLQKIRFDTLFKIENLIQKDVMNCKIIKMIIQPLIENAIYHGLSECDSNGIIKIQSYIVDDNLVLTISDNGIGMDQRTLNSLNDYINSKNEDFKGIALRNINRRLKLNYGNEYGLEIFSIKDSGTTMTLTLPYITD